MEWPAQCPPGSLFVGLKPCAFNATPGYGKGKAGILEVMTKERFEGYVEEFRTFSKFHKIKFGHRPDLRTLMSTVRSSERFRTELTSMVRSVLYREGEGVSRAELEQIVEVTWGGAEGDHRTPESAPVMAEIGGFLGEVLSRPLDEPLDVPAGTEEEGSVAIESGAQPAVLRPNPWVDGSALHRELMRFAEWRAKR